MRLLIIEPEIGTLERITSALRICWPDLENFNCSTGERGIELFDEESVDLVIVDTLLDDMSGLELVRQVRRSSDVPMITLTNGYDELLFLKSLEAGADECVSKPINQIAFIAIAKSLTRRYLGRVDEPSLVIGLLRLDAMVHKAYLAGREITLTRTENLILKHLMHNSGRTTTYHSLARNIWGDDYPGASNAIRTSVCRLRSKLGANPNLVSLVNERGVGIRLVPTS